MYLGDPAALVETFGLLRKDDVTRDDSRGQVRGYSGNLARLILFKLYQVVQYFTTPER